MLSTYTKTRPIYFRVCLFLFFISCTDSNDVYITKQDTYRFQKPAHFPEPTFSQEKNPITKDGFLLGKKLFFDPILSKDGSISCNNCHIQSNAFADSRQHPFSIGIGDAVGSRNAPGIFNLAFKKEFFIDGGVSHLDFVPINAIESPVEMGDTLKNVVKKLNNNAAYKKAFKTAFGIDTITSAYMLGALSQYMRMLISDDSLYDRYLQNQASFSPIQAKGLALFDTHCASCHAGVLQSDFSYRNNGISTDFSQDTGRERITESAADIGKFMVPSLRNVGLTSPYMHHAGMDTLEEVLAHYATGIKDSKTLDPGLKQNKAALKQALTPENQKAIIAFLHTLSDYTFTLDTRFMNSN